MDSQYTDMSLKLQMEDNDNGYNYTCFVNQNFQKDGNGVVNGLLFPEDLNTLFLSTKCDLNVSDSGVLDTKSLESLVGSNNTSNQALLNLVPASGTTDTIEFTGSNGTDVAWDSVNNKITINSTAPVKSDWNATTGLAEILNKPTIPPAYSLPIATAADLGGVKVGANLTIDANTGVLDAVQGSYTLPNAGVGATVFASNILMSGSSTGVSSERMRISQFTTNYVSIPAAATPTAHNITSYGNPFSSGNYVIQVSDTTNNKHFVTEAVAINNNVVEDFATFGGLQSTQGFNLGSFNVTNDTSNTIIQFTPDPNIDVQVRVFGFEIQGFKGNDFPDTKETDHLQIINTFIQYKGAKLEQNNQFKMNISDSGLGIFIRDFRGDFDGIVGVGTNNVTIPYHLFETGDSILYDGNEGRAGTSLNRIGIAETTVAGVTTDKLPRDLFAVKVSDSKLAFAETAADALLREPKTFQITSTGIGTFHQIKSKKTDERTMVVIDNMIQSPLADSDIETILSTSIESSTELRVVGIASFFAEDLVRIDDEFMMVLATWFDEDDSNFYMEVVRGMMGSNLAPHNSASIISKVSGQYNIVNNTINFVQSPKGNNPMSTTTEGPDEFDWTGITTHSSFQGRVFNRTSFKGIGVSSENYGENHVFDDISSQFSGITSDFVLKYENDDVVGISTDNAWVLINGVFQHPDGVARNGRTCVLSVVDCNCGSCCIDAVDHVVANYSVIGESVRVEPNVSNFSTIVEHVVGDCCVISTIGVRCVVVVVV